MIDIHSHILPGIDDGARNFEESVGLVRELAAQGVTDIIATPHYVNETTYTSPVFANEKLLEELRGFVRDAGIDVNLYLGNEIYIDSDILGLVKKGEMKALADSEYLLVELPFNEKISNYEDIFAVLLENGYKVLLAHPERYSYFHDEYEKLVDLIDMGVLFQCNLGSVTGKYGKSAMKTVRKLAKDGYIFAFGNDAHHVGRNDYLELGYKKLAKFYNERELEKVLVGNAKKIIS